MKKKRILFIANFYNPYNGIGKFIKDISEILINNNFRVIILTGKTEDNNKRIERIKGIIIIRSNLSFKFNRGYFSLPLIKDYIAIEKKIDIIYFHFPLAEILPLTLLSNKYKILHYHCLPAFVFKDFKFIIANIFFSISIFFSMLRCHKIITFTNDYFLSYPFNKIFLKKSVEIFPFTEIFEKNRYSNKTIIHKHEKPIIGFLGRICEEKGLEEIILSSKILDTKNILHEMIIAGDIEDKRFESHINKIISLSKNAKSIKFIGKLNEIEKVKLFKKIHILLLPSTNSFEAFGLVQLEAMSFGKLVIASELNGVRIPVKLTKNGLITKAKDANHLTECIIKCIEMAKIKKINEVLESKIKIFNSNDSIRKYLSVFRDN